MIMDYLNLIIGDFLGLYGFELITLVLLIALLLKKR